MNSINEINKIKTESSNTNGNGNNNNNNKDILIPNSTGTSNNGTVQQQENFSNGISNTDLDWLSSQKTRDPEKADKSATFLIRSPVQNPTTNPNTTNINSNKSSNLFSNDNSSKLSSSSSDSNSMTSSNISSKDNNIESSHPVASSNIPNVNQGTCNLTRTQTISAFTPASRMKTQQKPKHKSWFHSISSKFHKIKDSHSIKEEKEEDEEENSVIQNNATKEPKSLMKESLPGLQRSRSISMNESRRRADSLGSKQNAVAHSSPPKPLTNINTNSDTTSVSVSESSISERDLDAMLNSINLNSSFPTPDSNKKINQGSQLMDSSTNGEESTPVDKKAPSLMNRLRRLSAAPKPQSLNNDGTPKRMLLNKNEQRHPILVAGFDCSKLKRVAFRVDLCDSEPPQLLPIKKKPAASTSAANTIASQTSSTASVSQPSSTATKEQVQQSTKPQQAKHSTVIPSSSPVDSHEHHLHLPSILHHGSTSGKTQTQNTENAKNIPSSTAPIPSSELAAKKSLSASENSTAPVASSNEIKNGKVVLPSISTSSPVEHKDASKFVIDKPLSRSKQGTFSDVYASSSPSSAIPAASQTQSDTPSTTNKVSIKEKKSSPKLPRFVSDSDGNLDLGLVYTRCCHLREILPISSTLRQVIGHHVALSSLKLNNKKPTMIEILAFADFLEITPVTNVILDNTEMTPEMFRIILTSLIPSTKLEKLSLRDMSIQPESWDMVAYFLAVNKHVQKLDISGNSNFGHLDVFFSAMKLRGGIEEFIINNTGINGLVLKEFITRVCSISTKRIGLAANKLTRDDMKVICDWLADKNIHCEGLDLGGNDLKEIIGSFIDRIRNNSTLCFLSLDSTNLSPKCFVLLMDTLVTMPSIRYLDISNNPDIFPECFSHFLTSLPLFKNLRRLHLNHLPFSHNDLIHLAEVIPFCPNLLHISLRGVTHIDPAAAIALVESVKVSGRVYALDVDPGVLSASCSRELVNYCMLNMEGFIAPDDEDSSSSESDICSDEEMFTSAGNLVRAVDACVLRKAPRPSFSSVEESGYNSEELEENSNLKNSSVNTPLSSSAGSKSLSVPSTLRSGSGSSPVEITPVQSALRAKAAKVRLRIHKRLDDLYKKRVSGEPLSEQETERIFRYEFLDVELSKLLSTFTPLNSSSSMNMTDTTENNDVSKPGSSPLFTRDLPTWSTDNNANSLLGDNLQSTSVGGSVSNSITGNDGDASGTNINLSGNSNASLSLPYRMTRAPSSTSITSKYDEAAEGELYKFEKFVHSLLEGNKTEQEDEDIALDSDLLRSILRSNDSESIERLATAIHNINGSISVKDCSEKIIKYVKSRPTQRSFLALAQLSGIENSNKSERLLYHSQSDNEKGSAKFSFD